MAIACDMQPDWTVERPPAVLQMMDGTYFVSKNDLLHFINSTLGLNLQKIEQACPAHQQPDVNSLLRAHNCGAMVHCFESQEDCFAQQHAAACLNLQLLGSPWSFSH